VIHTADIQDRDGAPLVLAEIIRRFPWLRHVFADGGYAGDKLKDTLRRFGKWTIAIIKRSDTAKGFEVLPRRWVVERTLAWLNRNRRLAKDFEQTIASAAAWLFITSIQLFRRDFHAFVRQNNMPGLLTSFGGAPSDDLVAGIASTRPTFIRQLELVEANDEERLRAVSDYLRASADKADWADRGVIFPGSLDTWDDDLVRRHGMIRGDIADLHSHRSAPVQGRLVYRQCAQHQAPLEGRVVPGHFVHGSFNDLADRRRVGWHADYDSLLGDAPE